MRNIIFILFFLPLLGSGQKFEDSIFLFNETENLIEYVKPNSPTIKSYIPEEVKPSISVGVAYVYRFPYKKLKNGEVIIYNRFYELEEKYFFKDSIVILEEKYHHGVITSQKKTINNTKVSTNFANSKKIEQTLEHQNGKFEEFTWHKNGSLESYRIKHFELNIDSAIYWNKSGKYIKSEVNGISYPNEYNYLDNYQTHSYRIYAQDIFKSKLLTGSSKKGFSEIWLWKINEKKVIDTISVPHELINTVKISSNGHYAGIGFGSHEEGGISI